MTNTSATGGYLSPNVSPAPLEGKALLVMVHDLIAGITSMDTNLVLPRWQTEPPNIPAAATAWCSFGIMARRSDTFPYVTHKGDPDIDGGYDLMQRHEELDILASFYDQGVTGQADYLASLLRDGLLIAQNREAIQLQGFALGYTGDLTPLPTLLKERWLYRVDIPFTLRRQIDRTYPILNIKSFQGTLIGDTGGSQSFPIGYFVIGKSSIGTIGIQLIDDLLVTPNTVIP